MAERKGASYRIKSSRPAHHHGEHTQTTQATGWASSVSKRKTFQGTPLHQLGVGAYAETQTSPEIKMGDLLEMPGQGVAGYLHAAWPIAVTKVTGGMHSLTTPETGPGPDSMARTDEPDYQQRWQSAKALQRKRGYA